VVTLPPAAADGFITAAPTFSIRWVPPAVSAHVLARLTLLHAAPDSRPRWLSSNMLAVGAATRFDEQPYALTEPRRALVQPHYARDYAVAHGAGVGFNGSSAAWLVGARAPPAVQADSYAFASAQPLIPLNASTSYQFSAWCALAPNASAPSAMLWLGLFEADDFNVGLGPGPSYGRFAYMNSSTLSAEGLRGAPALWVSPAVRKGLAPALRSGGAAAVSAGGWAQLVISFTAPAFPCYADVRPIVLGGAGGAFFDQWALLRRETA